MKYSTEEIKQKLSDRLVEHIESFRMIPILSM